VLRILRRYGEATEKFKIAKKFTIFEERQTMIMTAFGFLVLPMSEDRRLIQNYVENLMGLIKFYKDRYTSVSEPFFDTFFVNGKW
jgi:hypothetical protein